MEQKPVFELWEVLFGMLVVAGLVVLAWVVADSVS